MKLVFSAIITISFLCVFNSFKYPIQLRKGVEIEIRAATTMRGNISPGDNKKDVVVFERLVKFLKHHEKWIFDLESHVDQRGSESANLKLTELRAKNIVSDLENKFGVRKGQLIPKGYGESKPIVSKAEISKMVTKESKEKAYQINRRIVVRAIGKRL